MSYTGVYWKSVSCIADNLPCSDGSLLISNMLIISIIFTKKNLYFTWFYRIKAKCKVRKLSRVPQLFIAFSKHKITNFKTCTVHLLLVICYNQQCTINLLKPTGYVMHHQFNIQQLYALPTLYLCVLYLSENKQRLVTVTA